MRANTSRSAAFSSCWDGLKPKVKRLHLHNLSLAWNTVKYLDSAGSNSIYHKAHLKSILGKTPLSDNFVIYFRDVG